MKSWGLTKPNLPRIWTASAATRRGNPKFRTRTRGAVSVAPRNGSPKFARLGRFFAVPRDGNHEFRKLGRLRSCRDMETQVPLTRGAVFVWAGDGNRKVPRTRRFPSCHETEAPKFRRLGRFSVVAATWKPELPAPRPRFLSWRDVEIPEFPGIGWYPSRRKKWEPPSSAGPGWRFPSRRDMETQSSPYLGGGFYHAAAWNPRVPRAGVAVSIAAGHGNPRFPRLGEIFRRATKWKPLVSPNWGGCPSCGEMEAGLYAPRHGKKKPGVPRGLDPRFRNTTSSPDSGDGFHRHGNPEFPVWRKKHGNPRFSSGGGTWKPQVSRARARPSAVCREMETPISLACFPRGRGRTRKPQVPQAWAGFTPCRDMEIWGFHATEHKFRRLATALAAATWKPQISRPQARNAFSKMRTKETTFE